MTDTPHLPRRYDEDEVGRILERASQLQVEEPRATRSGGGLSLAELEEIAREAGIDPRHLRRAAMEVDGAGGPLRGWDHFFGDRATLALETTVPGDLPEEGFERVVAVAQRVSHEHGQPSLLGRTLTWQAETSNKTRTMQVVVTSRDGTTHIRVEERLNQLAAGIFGGTMGGFGGGVGIGVGLPVGIEVLGSAAFAVAFPLGIVGLSYIASRWIYRGIVRRRTRALGVLLEAVAAEVRATVADAALAEPDRLPELPRG